MANYKCYPLGGSGSNTFSDNLVGMQITDGGGLTLGNFGFTTGFVEKSNRILAYRKIFYDIEKY